MARRLRFRKSMKTRLLLPAVLLALAGSLSLGLFYAIAKLEISDGVTIHEASDFYKPLAAHGKWVQVANHGLCWHPAGVAAGWRPYCNGYWEWTDAGWYWVSDEPWAWACYHYGSWVYDSNYGWVWVPGVEWAPAWVNWRMGGDYIGWAPCGPAGYTVEPSFYVFVESRHFHDGVRPDTVIVNKPDIVRKTTEIKNIRREQRQFDGKSQTVVVNDGPRVDTVEKATGHKYAVIPVREAYQQTFGSVPKTLKHGPAKPAPEHKLTPGGNSEMPKNLPPKQTIPQPPPERILSPANKECPPSNEQPHPKKIVPPVQPPHRTAPVVPHGNPVPNQKGPDKDKNKDDAQRLTKFQNILAQKQGDQWEEQDG